MQSDYQRSEDILIQSLFFKGGSQETMKLCLIKRIFTLGGLTWMCTVLTCVVGDVQVFWGGAGAGCEFSHTLCALLSHCEVQRSVSSSLLKLWARSRLQQHTHTITAVHNHRQVQSRLRETEPENFAQSYKDTETRIQNKFHIKSDKILCMKSCIHKILAYR